VAGIVNGRNGERGSPEDPEKAKAACKDDASDGMGPASVAGSAAAAAEAEEEEEEADAERPLPSR
jgi:hypothetical protein